MMSNINKREKHKNNELAIYMRNFDQSTPETPEHRQKRFSRRPQLSNTSLSNGKLSSNSTKYPLNQKVQPPTPSTQTIKKQPVDKRQMLSFIQHTAYIKSHKPHNNHTISQFSTFYCNSQQHLDTSSGKQLSKQSQQRKQLTKSNKKCYNNQITTNNQSINVNKPLILLSQGQSQSEQTNITSNCKKHPKTPIAPIYHHINSSNKQINRKLTMSSDPLEIQLELQIKKKELSLLEDQSMRLNAELKKKNKLVTEMSEQLKQCSQERDLLIENLDDTSRKLEGLITSYGGCSVLDTSKKENTILRLSNLIDTHLRTLLHSFQQANNQNRQQYQKLLTQLQQKLSNNTKTIEQLQLQTTFLYKYRDSNMQLHNQNKILMIALQKLKRKGQALRQQNNTFKMTNSKLRTCITQLKALNQNKQKYIEKIRKSEIKRETLPGSKHLKKQEQIQFSFDADIGISMGIKNRNNVTDLENQNNLSYDISNASTEQLMEMVDSL